MTDGNNSNSSGDNSLRESSSPSPSPSPISFTPTTLHTIPVVQEKPSLSKQSIVTNTIIEKRWVTKTS